MQRKLRSRFTRACLIVFASSASIVVSIIFTKPVYAAPVTVLDYSTNDSTSVLLSSNQTGSTTRISIEYSQPSASGSFFVTSMTTRFSRAGAPTAGSRIYVNVYQGGSNPGSSSGTLVAHGSIPVTNIPNTGSASDVDITFESGFYFAAGLRYYFEITSDDATGFATWLYQFTGGNSGIYPFYTNEFIGTWTHRPTTKTRLKLTGITSAEYFANVDLSNLSIYGPYLSQYTQGQASYQVNNGGYTNNFGAGTGSLFISDKAVYGTDEAVKLRWVFNSTFTVASVKLYSNGTGSTLLQTFTGSGATKNEEHRASISYANSGQYQPLVRVCSASCTTYQDIYLGGYSVPNPQYKLTVIRQLSILSITGAVVNTYTGSYINTYQGGTNATDTGSIFAIAASKLDGFGTTGNAYLDTASSILVLIPKAALFVAEKIFNVVQASAMFSFVVSTIHPPSGKTYVLPATLLHHSYPTAFSGKSFTISYNTNVNAPNLDFMVQLVVFLSIFTWAFRHLLFIHHHKK